MALVGQTIGILTLQGVARSYHPSSTPQGHESLGPNVAHKNIHTRTRTRARAHTHTHPHTLTHTHTYSHTGTHTHTHKHTHTHTHTHTHIYPLKLYTLIR